MFYTFNLNNFPVIYSSYTVSRATSWQIADKNNILIFISDGCCKITLDNQSYLLEKGDVFFIPAKNAYIRQAINNTLCTMHYIHFSTHEEATLSDFSLLHDSLAEIQQSLNIEALSDSPLQYPNTIYLKNQTKNIDFDKIKKLLDSIDMFSTNRQIMCGLQSQIALCNILVLLSQKTIETILSDASLRNSTSYPQKLRTAISYVIRHANQPITLEDLSAYCNISKHQLIRYFKNYLDTTPINYITEYKISRAKDLLSHQHTLSIKEIADELGFSSQYYFTKVFTKNMGETPTAYRHRVLNYGKY